jgi:hypothetical protein
MKRDEVRGLKAQEESVTCFEGAQPGNLYDRTARGGMTAQRESRRFLVPGGTTRRSTEGLIMDKKRKEPIAAEREALPALHIVDPSDQPDETAITPVPDKTAATPVPDETAPTPDDDLFLHDAITRKVRNPVLDHPLAAAEPAKMPPARFDTKWLLLAGIAAFALAAGAVALWKTSRNPVSMTPSPAPASAAVPPAPTPSAPAFPSTPTPVVPAAPAELSHIDISVRPAEATLVLDTDTAGGNRIKAEFAKDQRQHVVMASAPGYETFKKVISFANDVYLEIELKKKPGSVRRGAKPHASPSLTKATGKADTTPAANQGEEGGATLGPSEARRPAKKSIDEKDPYLP